MCLGPEMLASLALSAAGSAMQTSSNNSSLRAQQNAKNRVVAEGIAQQAENQRQSGAQFDSTMSKFKPEQQQQELAAKEGARTAALSVPANQIPSTGNSTTASESTPKVIQSDLAKRMAEATAFGAQQAGALGKIGATGDQFLDNDLNTMDSARKIGTISDFAARQAQINRLKQQTAYSNAAKPASPFGSILGMVGSAGVMDAAGGGKGMTQIGDFLFPGASNPPAVEAALNSSLWG